MINNGIGKLNEPYTTLNYFTKLNTNIVPLMNNLHLLK